jgi:hypothetical protein
MTNQRPLRFRVLGSLAVVSLLATVAEAGLLRRGPQTFLDSDDYRDGEEVVGVLLGDDEYALMIEGIEFRGIEFDWTWYKADYAKPRKPTRLLFRAADYGTVRVAPVTNHSPAVAPGVEEEVRELFVHAMERLGLRVAADGEEAALELDVAIVDYKADSTYIFVGNVDPFIELEVRLRETATGEPLLLVRNQDHNSTPVLGAADTAGALIRVLQ